MYPTSVSHNPHPLPTRTRLRHRPTVGAGGLDRGEFGRPVDSLGPNDTYTRRRGPTDTGHHTGPWFLTGSGEPKTGTPTGPRRYSGSLRDSPPDTTGVWILP